MFKFTTIHLIVILILACSKCFSQERIVYKQIDTTKLSLEIYFPEKIEKSVKYPAVVFFSGGGWKSIAPKQFLRHAEYFSKRGMVCFLADYRVESINKTSPFESMKDAKSAIRFIRKKAAEFHVDTSKIVASGGSAGGHLAAATALIKGYNEKGEDTLVSCVPNALVLFNPVFDSGPGGYAYERIGEAYRNFSPLHNIHSGAPPTIVFIGTNDHLIPIETARYFKTVMDKLKSRCDLKIYEGEGHGFSNHKNFENYKSTIIETDIFLQSIGFISGESKVEIE